MIDSYINKIVLCVLLLCGALGLARAQAPSINLKNGPFIFKLDDTGSYTVQLSDVATVIPDATDPVPYITINPAKFDCDHRGKQTVTITATDAPEPVTFNKPTGIVADLAGNFYITDAGNHKIRKISAAGIVSDFAGSGKVGIADGLGAAASFDTPQGIAIDAAGNLFVTDVQAKTIRKITPAGLVSTIAGTPYSSANDRGSGTGISFDEPYGIAVDNNDVLYVADATHNLIRRVNQAGDVSTFAGNGVAGYKDANITVGAEFNTPTGIAIDAAGNLYVADTYNERIRKITPDGTVSTIAGSGVSGLNDGRSIAANFSNPNNLIVDANGIIYVADTQNEAIRKIDNLGNVMTIAGNGQQGDQDGTPYQSSFILTTFNTPEGLAFDATGNLYVGDSGNNKIRQITFTSYYTVSTVAGTGDAGDTNGNLHPGNFATTSKTVSVDVETTLKITTKYSDVTLGPCVIAMPDFVTSNPPQTFDNCNNNIPAHQQPAPGTPLNGNAATQVFIIVEDATGKYDTTSFTAYTGNVPPAPAVSITALPTTAVCQGSPLTFTASTVNADNPTYQWLLNGKNAGINAATFTGIFNNGDAVQCHIMSNTCALAASSAPYTVSVSPRPAITFKGNLLLKYGNSIALNPAVTGDIKSYKWYPADNLSSDTVANPLADPPKTTTYRLTALSATGCDTTAAVTVTVINNVIIPNTFTPNGDNINDKWDIPGLVFYPGCTVSVYNRYGALVYHSISYAQAWNGTYNGNALPLGTYYYVIDLKNGTAPLSGSVTILK